MSFRRFLRSRLPLLFPLFALLATPVSAQIRLVSTDARGVTLRLDVPDLTPSPADPDGASRLLVKGFPGTTVPGRAALPFASTMIAIPRGARVTARLIGGDAEESREDVRLRTLPRPGLRDDGGALGVVPTLEAIPPVLDGAWPRSPVEVGEPASIRRLPVVAVRLFPFRYDPASRRLWSRRSMIVRLDFSGGAAPSIGALATTADQHFEPVMKNTVLNYEQGRGFAAPASRDAAVGTRLRLPWPESRPRAVGGAVPPGFDEDHTEVRVQIDSTGVYTLDFQTLETRGFPADIPIAQVSVHRHEYVENARPSYVTFEIPIEVDDVDGDGLFNHTDRILIYVQSWAERSRVSMAQRTWGDAEMVYVTQVDRPGLRIAPRSGWRNQVLSQLVSYPWTQRWEKNIYYMNTFRPTEGVDTTTDQFQWTEIGSYTHPDSFKFETNDPDTSQRARFTLYIQGRRDNNHVTFAHVRNGAGQITSVIDSLFWGGTFTGRSALIQTVNMFGSALTSGNTNVLRTWGKTNPADQPYVDPNKDVVNTAVNYFEATYWRNFVAINRVLKCTTGSANGPFEILATGFRTDSIRVYDVSDSTTPTRLIVPESAIDSVGRNRYAIHFQDSTSSAAPRRYVVFDRPKTVAADHYHAVTRYHLNEETSADYLLIVPEAFREAADSLAALRRSLGLNVLVAPLEGVNDEFNGGRHSSYSIRRFIRYAYRNWDSEFVLLLGDGTEDPLNYSRSAGYDWIPLQKIVGTVGVYDGASIAFEAIPSDPWYVWCVDCPVPNGDKLHDLFIGRLPVNSPDDAMALVRKLTRYEQITPDQDWRHKMLLVSDDAYSTTSTFGGPSGGPEYCRKYYEMVFLEINEIVRSVILDEAMLRQSNVELFALQYYLRNEPYTIPAGSDTCRGTGDIQSWLNTRSRCHLAVTPQLFDRLNAGQLWFNYQGHANQYVLTHEDLYVNGAEDDKERFANDGSGEPGHGPFAPPFFTAFSCHPNSFGSPSEADFQRGPALGEEMVTLHDRGAIASWASSGFELLPIDATNHLNVWLARALFADSVHDETLGDKGARVVIGEAIATTLIHNRYTSFGSEAEVGVSYQLLGDPATRFSIGSPQATVTVNGQPVEDNVPVELASAGDTLRIEADLASNVMITSIEVDSTDVTGTYRLPHGRYTLSPAFPDTVAPGLGGRLYHLTLRTSLGADSVRYTLRTRDRNGIDGRFDVVFKLQSFLYANGQFVVEGDVVTPDAHLTMYLRSLRSLGTPPGPQELSITLNGQPVPFNATAVDGSGKVWKLDLQNGALPPGTSVLVLNVLGIPIIHRFNVEAGQPLILRNVFAFPNPFDETGTSFSFDLVSDRPSDVLLRVYTVSGS
jgi:hypothetical protein